MGEIGYWPIWTPIDGDDGLDEFSSGFVRQLVLVRPGDMLPIVLALSACFVLFGVWWSVSPALGSERREGLVEAELAGSGVIVYEAVSNDEANSSVLTAGGLSSMFTPEVHFWREDILRWSAEYAVDPNIVATIMQIESCGNPAAVSVAGARGLFQVMPFHFVGSEDMLDPNTNAMRGLLFFREQMRFTGGDILLSFAGYNGGYAASGGAYESWPAETKRYHYWAQGIYEDARAGLDSSTRLDEWLAAGGAGGCRLASEALGLQ